jgi:hypothetical protein
LPVFDQTTIVRLPDLILLTFVRKRVNNVFL